MLILAGVSLNAIVGDNGVITQAMKAKEAAEEAARREELEFMLFNFNASEYADQSNGLDDYLINSKKSGEIDNFITSTDGEIVVIEKDGQYYQLEKNSNDGTYEVSNTLGDNIKTILEEEAKLQAEGEKTSSIILTQKTLNETEGFSFKNGQTYIIVDENLQGDDFDFNIPAGDPVTIKIAYNMTIDNSSKPDKSAIDIARGGTLDLYVYGNVTVNSGFGAEGETASGLGAKGGLGGHAGIHVPGPNVDTNTDGKIDYNDITYINGIAQNAATLNIAGTGKLLALGGNAGDGGGVTGGGNTGGGRRRPELELVLDGDGGPGGDANAYFYNYNNDLSSTEMLALLATPISPNSGQDGGNGEACGIVSVSDNIEIWSYGGGGAASGIDGSNNSGAGAGGYPAAGIGRWRCWPVVVGDHACSAGGYSAAEPELYSTQKTQNGLGSTMSDMEMGGGGGYYAMGDPYSYTRAYFNQGGMWAKSAKHSTWTRDCAGSGGNAGAGGIVYYTNIGNIHAFNGNRITNGTETTVEYFEYNIDGTLSSTRAEYRYRSVNNVNNGDVFIPAKIFGQNGETRDVYISNQRLSEEECEYYGVPYITNQKTIPTNVKIKSAGNIDVLKDNNGVAYGQGIGTGAGYVEVSNGQLVKK